jgi:hypothetical protein
MHRKKREPPLNSGDICGARAKIAADMQMRLAVDPDAKMGDGFKYDLAVRVLHLPADVERLVNYIFPCAQKMWPLRFVSLTMLDRWELHLWMLDNLCDGEGCINRTAVTDRVNKHYKVLSRFKSDWVLGKVWHSAIQFTAAPGSKNPSGSYCQLNLCRGDNCDPLDVVVKNLRDPKFVEQKEGKRFDFDASPAAPILVEPVPASLAQLPAVLAHPTGDGGVLEEDAPHEEDDGWENLGPQDPFADVERHDHAAAQHDARKRPRSPTVKNEPGLVAGPKNGERPSTRFGDAVAAAVATMASVADSLEQENQNHKTEIKTLEAKLSEQDAQHAAELATERATVAEQAADLDTAHQMIDTERAIVAEQAAELATVNAELETTRAQLQRLKAATAAAAAATAVVVAMAENVL